MNNYRHESSGTTNKIMRRILSGENEDGTKKYNILLSLGRSWKDKTYMNANTGNTFKGEPSGIVTSEAMPFTEGRLKWGITYTFTGYRDNVFVNKQGQAARYGAGNRSMDRLFYILVNKFNSGVDFVQKYLDEVAPSHLGNQIKEVVEPAVKAFEDRVLKQKEIISERERQAKADKDIVDFASSVRRNKKGELDSRFVYRIGGISTGQKIADIYEDAEKRLESFYKDLESGKLRIKGKRWNKEGERLASLLKADFVSSMNSGEVPLAKTFLAESTKKTRLALGFDDTTVFSASSQFVKSIQFKVRIKNA